MPVVNVRAADLRDLPGLMRIEDECFGVEKFSPDTIRSFIERTDTFVIVAIEAEETIGSAMCMVSVERGEGRVASVAVLPSFRMKSVGTKLLEECESEFIGRGLAISILEVDIANEAAMALYESLGYAVLGIIKDFYGAGRDAYSMEKTLRPKGEGIRVKIS